jgi:hypothetical protein
MSKLCHFHNPVIHERQVPQCESTGLVEADFFASLAPRADPWSSEEVPLCGSCVHVPTLECEASSRRLAPGG